MRRFLIALAVVPIAAPIYAAPVAKGAAKPASDGAVLLRDAVNYAPPAPWVAAAPPPTTAPTPENSPFRFIFADSQIHIGPDGQDSYTHWRVRILKPEALAAGNITLTWNPASGAATVHALTIHRDGEDIDVLAGQKFRVIQREAGLEQSTITGDLTAMVQTPGLQVGDELEVAYTLRRRDLTLADHSFGDFTLPGQGMPGAFRSVVTWPAATPLVVRSTPDLTGPAVVNQGARKSITYQINDPRGVVVNAGAPPRYNLRRLVEYSDFADWADVSRRFWPLFRDAAVIPAGSSLHARIDAIAKASTDPQARAMAALQLVQDQIRYVYVGLDGGNYRPATVEETWARRYGDCKAKTVLLLAVLRALDVPAEAVLVNALVDDGANMRLPSPGAFNHVLVRATVGGRGLWLDGTRSGDRFVDRLPEPYFHWALPLREKGAPLEPVKRDAFTRPQFIGVMDVDASGGYDVPARVSSTQILRGDDAWATRTTLNGLSKEDADRALRNFWRKDLDWVQADTVGWRFDERTRTTVLTMSGKGKVDWDMNGKGGHSLTLWGAGFYPPDTLRRPAEQDQSVPWALDFPKFKCWATSLRLPAAAARKYWDYEAQPVSRTISGVTYWRDAALVGNVIRTVMSRSVNQPEMNAVEAAVNNMAIPGFNNRQSNVFESSDKPSRHDSTLPFADTVDWAQDDGACVARSPRVEQVPEALSVPAAKGMVPMQPDMPFAPPALKTGG